MKLIFLHFGVFLFDAFLLLGGLSHKCMNKSTCLRGKMSPSIKSRPRQIFFKLGCFFPRGNKINFLEAG